MSCTLEVLRVLSRLGYLSRRETWGIRLEWQGPDKPDPQVVRPLLEIVKARQGEALALLEAEMGGENPSCKTCSWCMSNPWNKYPDLPLWCGWWWDYLRADSAGVSSAATARCLIRPPRPRTTAP